MQDARIEKHQQAMSLFTFFSSDIHHDDAQSITDLWSSERNSGGHCEAVQHVLDDSRDGRV